MENLVGRQVKGFEFEGGDPLIFNSEMKYYIGKIGTIMSINYYGNPVVEFDDATWSYPLDQIQPHLIPLEVFKLGQKVWDMSISEEEGKVVSIDNSLRHPIIAEFNSIRNYYKIDGINKYGQRTLSSAPYTFQGFSQETIIERGTLVYFKDYKEFSWNIGFYNKFEDGKHFVFEDQNKDGISMSWKFCQTENPLI